MEFVLVVPRVALFPECTPHGLVPFSTAPADGGYALSAEALRALDWKRLAREEEL